MEDYGLNLGILAGMWPCGTVTLIDELFRAEAKSQVYGSVHSLMYLNSSTLSDISKSCTQITKNNLIPTG